MALYETIGCFRDTGNRAISTLEGQDIHLDGNYRLRKYAIYKCYRAAKKQGFQVFAVQNGGWCASSAIAATTFNKYGKSTACKNDGEGGPWANQVYYIKGIYIDTNFHNVYLPGLCLSIKLIQQRAINADFHTHQSYIYIYIYMYKICKIPCTVIIFPIFSRRIRCLKTNISKANSSCYRLKYY